MFAYLYIALLVYAFVAILSYTCTSTTDFLIEHSSRYWPMYIIFVLLSLDHWLMAAASLNSFVLNYTRARGPLLPGG